MSSKNYYKYCIVPTCESTTVRTPDKLFVRVPVKNGMRKKWLQLAKRDTNVSSNSRMYFCEDHFDLKKDMENYMEYHIMGSVSQVRLKPGCIPTKFSCQSVLRNQISYRNQISTDDQSAQIKEEDVHPNECVHYSTGSNHKTDKDMDISEQVIDEDSKIFTIKTEYDDSDSEKNTESNNSVKFEQLIEKYGSNSQTCSIKCEYENLEDEGIIESSNVKIEDLDIFSGKNGDHVKCEYDDQKDEGINESNNVKIEDVDTFSNKNVDNVKCEYDILEYEGINARNNVKIEDVDIFSIKNRDYVWEVSVKSK